MEYYRLFRFKSFWVTIIFITVVVVSIIRLGQVKLVIENDSDKVREFIVNPVDSSDIMIIKINAGNSKALYFSKSDLFYGKVKVCVEKDNCQYVSYNCPGFGGCLATQQSKLISYSHML